MSEVTVPGAWIRQVRLAGGLRQRDVANALGVVQQAVSSWEQDRAQPSSEHLSAFCELLSVTAPEVTSTLAIVAAEPSPTGVLAVEGLPAHGHGGDKFVEDVVRPRMSSGVPLTEAEIAFLRDLARSVYKIDLGF